MNCIGGCIAGGGQPKITLLEMENTKKKRMAALYKEDEAMTLRLCHENKEIIDIYNDYFEKPNSELAEKLLHTSYQDKSYLLGGKENA
jgi:ferredoxin hydrogenase